MKKNYLFKLLLSVALLIGGCGCVMAQDGKAKAEELFRFLMDGKGDSVHVRLTEDIRSKIITLPEWVEWSKSNRKYIM